MITCKKCKTEKSEDQMKPRNGAPSKVCLECDEKAKAERARLKKVLEEARAESLATRKSGGRKKKASPRKAKRVVQEKEPNEVLIAPGLGVRAFLTEDDRLQLAQRNDDRSFDNVVLSKTEFKVIAAQFHDWMETPDPS